MAHYEPDGPTENPGQRSHGDEGHHPSSWSRGNLDPGPFPVEALPPALADMVTATAEAQQVDPAYLGVPLLGILAGCIGTTRCIELKPGYTEPAILWTILIAPSGTGKTPALKAMLQPVRHRDAILAKRNQEHLRAYNAAQVTSRGGADPATALERPKMLAHIIEDATLEAIHARHADNPRGLLLAVDELGGWLLSFNKYRSGGGDEQAWLSMHSGMSVKVDRKGSASSPPQLFLERTAVSVVGGIQPGVAPQVVGSQGLRHSGFLARFLMAAPPFHPRVWTDSTTPPDVTREYARCIESLLDLEHDPEGNPIHLTLTEKAATTFHDFYNECGVATHNANQNFELDAAPLLSKLPGTAARIALCLALARSCESGMAMLLQVVNEADMRGAIQLAEWLATSTRRIYAEWRLQRSGGGDATMLSDMAVQNLVWERCRMGPATRTELHRILGRRAPADRLDAALEALHEAGRIRREASTRQGPGRPSETWVAADPEE